MADKVQFYIELTKSAKCLPWCCQETESEVMASSLVNLQATKNLGRKKNAAWPDFSAQAFLRSRMNMPVLVSSSNFSDGFLVIRLTSIMAASDSANPYMLGCMGMGAMNLA